MDVTGNVAINFARRLGLQDCIVVTRAILPTGEAEILVSGSMSPLTDPEPENAEAVRLFYSEPFKIRIRVSNGTVTGHEWDKMQFS